MASCSSLVTVPRPEIHNISCWTQRHTTNTLWKECPAKNITKKTKIVIWLISNFGVSKSSACVADIASFYAPFRYHTGQRKKEKQPYSCECQFRTVRDMRAVMGLPNSLKTFISDVFVLRLWRINLEFLHSVDRNRHTVPLAKFSTRSHPDFVF